jgi:hypothetical protein
MSLHWLPMLLLLALFFPAGNASADDHRPAPTEFSFDDTRVDGTLQAPKGEVLFVRKRAQRESLIKVREKWVDELVQSVENL